jgi:hypothetical protein
LWEQFTKFYVGGGVFFESDASQQRMDEQAGFLTAAVSFSKNYKFRK